MSSIALLIVALLMSWVALWLSSPMRAWVPWYEARSQQIQETLAFAMVCIAITMAYYAGRASL